MLHYGCVERDTGRVAMGRLMRLVTGGLHWYVGPHGRKKVSLNLEGTT